MSPRFAPRVSTLFGVLSIAMCRTPDPSPPPAATSRAETSGLEARLPDPGASPAPDAWSPVVNGLDVQLATDKTVYRSGEGIALTLFHRNREALPWVAVVGSPRNLAVGAPLYGIASLTVVRLADGRATERRLVLRPVDSQMFLLGRLERIEPGAVHATTGVLDTWAWEPADRPNPRETPMVRLEPGTYTVSVHLDGRSDVLDGRTPENLERLRRFFAGPDTSLATFARARIMGFSYRDAELLRDSGYRLWSGEIDTPPVRFVVAAASGDGGPGAAAGR